MELTEIERSAINLMLENSGDHRRVDDLSSAEVEGFILDIRRRQAAFETASLNSLKKVMYRRTSVSGLNSNSCLFSAALLSAIILLFFIVVGIGSLIFK